MSANFAQIGSATFKKFTPSDVISFTLFLMLPAILPLVRRAGPLILIVTGLFAAFVLWREARLSNVWAAYIRKPAILLFITFIAYATISLGWSSAPIRGATFIATTSILVASMLLISEFPLSKHAPAFLAIGLSFGGAIIAFDLLTGMNLLEIIHKEKSAPYRYNMTLVAYCVMGLGMFDLLRDLKQFKVFIALFFVCLATFLSESETVKLVWVMFPIMFGITLIIPQSVIKPVSFFLFAVVFFFAATGMPGLSLLKTIVPIEFWRHASGDERLLIWSGVADFAFHGLPFGWGVEILTNAQGTPYFMGASKELQRALSQWHAHNNFLQILTELGLPGLAASCAGLGVLLSNNFPNTRRRIAAYVTFVTAIMGIAAISPGFWQSWWWTVVLIGWYALIGGAAKYEDRPN